MVTRIYSIPQGSAPCSQGSAPYSQGFAPSVTISMRRELKLTSLWSRWAIMAQCKSRHLTKATFAANQHKKKTFHENKSFPWGIFIRYTVQHSQMRKFSLKQATLNNWACRNSKPNPTQQHLLRHPDPLSTTRARAVTAAAPPPKCRNHCRRPHVLSEDWGSTDLPALNYLLGLIKGTGSKYTGHEGPNIHMALGFWAFLEIN